MYSYNQKFSFDKLCYFNYKLCYWLEVLTLNQNLKKLSCLAVLTLAYQSLGVVYGDLSTSPLYVYKTTFSGKLSLHENDEEVYGVLSFIFWTLTLIPLFKYIFIVMSADDNGEGTPFSSSVSSIDRIVLQFWDLPEVLHVLLTIIKTRTYKENCQIRNKKTHPCIKANNFKICWRCYHDFQIEIFFSYT